MRRSLSLPTVLACAQIACALIASTAAPARAQQQADEFERAVLQQVELQSRQAAGLRRAEARAYAPLTAENAGLADARPAGRGDARASASGRTVPASVPGPGTAGFAWALAGLAASVLGLLAWIVLRRSRA